VNLRLSILTLCASEYFTHGLRRIDLDPDPIRQFAIWFTAALEVGIAESEFSRAGDGSGKRAADHAHGSAQELRSRWFRFLHQL
jgi:hypothetical protein